tara:strand:+ start:95 stop:439 length:345 start_codon:yes stop_codon:yes gene_type:complete
MFMATVTATKKVEYVEFEHDSKELFAEAEFVFNVEVTPAAPYSGYDFDPSDFYVLLTEVTDADGKEYPKIELRGNKAKSIFDKSGVELTEICIDACEAEEEDHYADCDRSGYDD